MNKKIGPLLFVLLNSLSVAAFAAVTATSKSADIPRTTTPAAQGNPAAGTATSTANEVSTPSDSLLDRFTANIFSIYHGAPIKDPGSKYSLNNKGQKNTSTITNFDSEVNLAFLLTKNIGIGPSIPFLIIPSSGQHFVIQDAGIRVFDRKTISTEGFNLYTNLILQAPTSDYSKKRGMDYAVKTTPNFRYLFPHSNFRVGAFTEAKAYMGVTKGKTFKLWAGPYISYSLSDHFALSVLYEMEANHLKNQPSFHFVKYQTDLQPGFVWNITSHVMINPYVQIFTGTKISLENSGLGAVFSATLL